MTTETERAEYVRAVFREIALTLAGVFSLYDVNDEAIQAITRGVLDVFEAHASPEILEPPSRTHPAVSDMIARINGDAE